jgi:DNA repair photolyase
LKTNLGWGNTIFVGSSCDLFAKEVDREWIERTLEKCRQHDNTYFFQTKNPDRAYWHKDQLPENSIIGTTIESDRIFKEMGSAPGPFVRAKSILMIKDTGFRTTITIEPIMDFNIELFTRMIKNCCPDFVSIGANTMNKIAIVEPSHEKIEALILYLNEKTNIEVKIKDNLKRLWRAS